MKQLFLDKSINLITKYNSNYTDEDVEKLLYGLEGLYLTITKMIIIFLVALILGLEKELILLLILFNIIRYTGFGFHADKSIECLIFSTLLFIGLPFITLKINFTNIEIISIYVLCLLSYILYAPADTPKRPLPNKKKRKIRKLSTIGISIIYLVSIYIFNNNTYTAIVISSLLIETIMILPLTYKIFNQTYNNYKIYKIDA